MLRKVVGVISAICLICTVIATSAFAAPDTEHESVSNHSHNAAMVDQAAVARAKAEWSKKVTGLGGKVFDTKEALLNYLISVGYPTPAEKVASLVEDGFYAVVSPSAARSLGVNVPVKATGGDEGVVILQAVNRYCEFCKKVAIFIAQAVLGGYTFNYWQVIIDWLRQWICSDCYNQGYEDQTTHYESCPDCGPEGSPEVTSGTDTRVRMWCPRCLSTWYDYNPY